jgi:plasmid maintenance system antidote protein VapI
MSKSSTTIEPGEELLHNPHAGEILKEEFLDPLARYFRMSEGFFLGLQTDYEIRERKRALGDALDKITPRAA